MNINALLEEETGELEDLIEGWKIDRDKKIISDGKDVYEYLELKRFGDWYKVMNHNGVGFIFPNTRGIYKIKEEYQDYAIVENNGLRVVNLKTMAVSGAYDGVYVSEVNNGVVCIAIWDKGKARIAKLGSEEMRSSLYDDIWDLNSSDGVFYFAAEERKKRMVVLFDGKREIKSEMFDEVVIKKFENGVLYFKGKKGNKWIKGSISIN